MHLDSLTDDAKIDMINPYLVACLEEIEAKLESLQTQIDNLTP